MAYRLHEVNEDFIKDKLDKQKSSSKFPKIFKTNVDITKITNWPAIKKWIQHRIDQLIPDDEIFVEYVYELIRSDSPCPDIKAIQLQVDDFLGKEDSLEFCTQLWQLLIDSEHGKLKDNKQVKEQPVKEQPVKEQPVKEQSTKEQSDRKEEKQVQEQHEAKIQSPKKTKTNYNRSSSYTSKSNESTNKTSYRSQNDRDYRRDRDLPTYKANTHGQRQRESPDERYRDERRIRARKGN
ncbi:uncharacterized protein SPAPADRAFT_61131 [Spathaspora passalidarum NRRL Y-27907]|uniref:U1 small nuclear ribonucleoprotein component SNU71 n=1 Tax=Spathaspora passalidarum (strain NRRL Y-27907 / 11-Y1) TaxID=619300 RepID=G3AP01_SPAPN|nr:uncharacterized protein SPAPADRAFT_61131 [Spathaspora passalidarum NRRL Y-27907]EGW32032.1 hypothetical protein SPAPADRAFT_61131 [Spathaspora passalidarum NRRL Y-27907]